MEWTDAEWNSLRELWERADRPGDADETVREIASRAVELVAARGGAMTPERVGLALHYIAHERLEIYNDRLLSDLGGHVAAQGARIAALEAELSDTREARDSAVTKTQEWRSKAKDLEQHVSELERALDAARDERDEALSENAAGSQENGQLLATLRAVAKVLEHTGPGVVLPGVVHALVKERDEALADNAALRETLAGAVKTIDQFTHAEACSVEDEYDTDDVDGCECILKEMSALRAVVDASHPGAGLLERMRRLEDALQLARDEASMLARTTNPITKAIGTSLLTMLGLADH